MMSAIFLELSLLPALGGHRRRTLRQLVGLARVVGVLPHRGRKLLHRRRRLLQGTGLGLGARTQVMVALGDLGTRRVHRIAALAHRGNHLHQLVSHPSQGIRELRHLVMPRTLEILCQIALCHGLGEADRLVHGVNDAGEDAEEHDEKQAQHDCAADNLHPTPKLHTLFGRLYGPRRTCIK